jgi:hypothetical protein
MSNCIKCEIEFSQEFPKQLHCSHECFIDDYLDKNQRIMKEFAGRCYFLIYKRDDFKCVYCGRSAHEGFKLYLDHIYPLSKGGQNHPFNLATCCPSCNTCKGERTLTKEQVFELWKRNIDRDAITGATETYNEVLSEFTDIYKQFTKIAQPCVQ